MRQAVCVALTGILIGVSPLPMTAQSALDRGPDGKTHTVVPGIDVPTLQGVPFAGTDTIIRTRPVEGGGSVVTSVTSKVVRDSQGRVYREHHHFGPPNTDPQKTLYAFYVLDPIAKTRTECTLATRRCTVVGYRPSLAFPLAHVGPFDGGKRSLARENLGQNNVDDLNLVGTREITTIFPGTAGNDQTLTLTREFWYSPDLKTNISVTRTDPREGTEAIHLAILSRGEPDPSAFAIPSNYVVNDLRSRSKPGN
jgi:hypothetical protein